VARLAQDVGERGAKGAVVERRSARRRQRVDEPARVLCVDSPVRAKPG